MLKGNSANRIVTEDCTSGLSLSESREALVQELKDREKGLHFLVNNAAVICGGPLE
jgi:NAD(P)-dependent dehydrogenase (short-subunit alcohol dehydrogenase family)